MKLLAFALVLIVLAWIVHATRVPIRHRWRRRQASAMARDFLAQGSGQAPQRIYARLRAMDPLAFEELLLECFAARGCKVIRNRRYTGDGGIDGQVILQGRRWLVQAKRYASAIRPEHVEAFALLCRRQNRPGLFIHTGRTGGLSRTLLERHPHIAVISGDRLIALVTGQSLILDGVEL